MSKAVLISIRPKWCQKIVSGEKTIEIRKTRPRMVTPFRCYIYCTQSGDMRRLVGERGKVIGEFVCGRIDRLARVGFDGSGEPAKYCICNSDMSVWPMDGICEEACLTHEELEKYLGGYEGYGLHISRVKIYEAPKELSEFRRVCPNDLYCESCAMYRENKGTCGEESLRFKRPPLSWCYVEEM